ncbi:MAG: GAF domain-containing sensor histidine kinase [Ardenticatenaceae bacterium]|nr:GAF domain-containing sensor histidine kinase [Ardenticatenaceae bacterium]
MTLATPLPASSAHLHAALLAIAEAEMPDMVLQQAAAAAGDLFGGAQVLVAISEGGQKYVHLRPMPVEVYSFEPLASWLLGALSTQPALLELSADTADFSTAPRDVQMVLAAPIQDYGVLAVLLREAKADLSPDERGWLQLVAGQTAVSLRKAYTLQTYRAHSEQLEERNRQLAAFSHAVRSIAGELALDKVLQQIVDSARDLVHVEYVALGVPNSDGYLDTFVYSGMDKTQVAQMPHLPHGHGLLGAIIHEKRPIRIPAIGRDPRSVGFPDGHPLMESFLGVPIVAAGETLGNLYLTNKIGAEEFSSDDQKLAELLAAHAAVAIQNARLYEQVGRLVIVEERTRIGMDLHDGVIQSIYAVGLTLESTRLSLTDGNFEDADHLLEHAILGLNDTIRDIRNFILDLRPHRFKGNLYDGLSKLVREFQVNAMVAVDLNATAEALAELRTPQARALFLTTQEALANVARHARAKHVDIIVQRTDGFVQLTIVDDGKGFDIKERIQSTVGHGLSNMRARAEELKGTFQLQSAPKQGTRIVLTIPLS